jgi:hypothetical protein
VAAFSHISSLALRIFKMIDWLHGPLLSMILTMIVLSQISGSSGDLEDMSEHHETSASHQLHRVSDFVVFTNSVQFVL